MARQVPTGGKGNVPKPKPGTKGTGAPQTKKPNSPPTAPVPGRDTSPKK